MYSNLEIKKDAIILNTGDAEFHPSTVNINGRCYFRDLPSNRHPIGLKPKFIHDEQRVKEIQEAILRYMKANKPIPDEWRKEYNDLVYPLTEGEALKSKNCC